MFLSTWCKTPHFYNPKAFYNLQKHLQVHCFGPQHNPEQHSRQWEHKTEAEMLPLGCCPPYGIKGQDVWPGCSSNNSRSWSPNAGTSISVSKILNSWTRGLQMSFSSNDFWSIAPNAKMRNPRRGVTFPVSRRARIQALSSGFRTREVLSYYRICSILLNHNQ